MNNFKVEIEKYMSENKISKTEFCKRASLSMCTLNKFLNGNSGKCRANFILNIARVTKCSCDYLTGLTKK